MEPTPRPPAVRPRSSDPQHPTPTPGSGLGAFLDQSGAALGRAGEVGSRITDAALRLAAGELADRATAATPTPGLVVRLGRKVFGRGRPPTPKARPPKPTPRPTPSTDLAPMPTWMRWVGVWLDRTVGALPLLAPLVVSGWYTAHVGTDALDLAWPIALALTIALEGGVWRLGRLYEDTLVAGDSTIALRLGLLAYVAAIGGLIFWHATAQATDVWHADWRPAAVVSCMSLAGIYIWSRRARWRRRAELRAAGRVDSQLVRFSVWSWLVAPLETAAALRYAVKHRIDRPVEAVEAYRADRDLRRADRAHRRESEKAAKAEKKSADKAADKKPAKGSGKKPTRTAKSTPVDPTPTANAVPSDPTPADPTRSEPTPRPRSTRPGRPVLGSVDDATVLTRLGEEFGDRVPSINEVEGSEKAVRGKCSRDRAIRLRNLYRDQLAEKSA